MSYDGHKITVNGDYGVSTTDLQKCFKVILRRSVGSEVIRVLSGDLGTNISKKTGDAVGTYAVESRENINPWARFKPVVLNKLFTTDEWDFINKQWKATATWFRGLNQTDPSANFTTFGFVVPFKPNASQIIALYTGSADNWHGWTFTLPNGTLSQPFRLTDFAGYKHDASPICGERGIIFPDKLSPDKLECEVTMMMKSGDSDDEVNLSDFFQQGCHFGVIITTDTTSPSVIYWQFCKDKLTGTAHLDLKVQDGLLTTGNYYRAYPFFVRGLNNEPTARNDYSGTSGNFSIGATQTYGVSIPVIASAYHRFRVQSSSPSIQLLVSYYNGVLTVRAWCANGTGPYAQTTLVLVNKTTGVSTTYTDQVVVTNSVSDITELNFSGDMRNPLYDVTLTVRSIGVSVTAELNTNPIT